MEVNKQEIKKWEGIKQDQEGTSFKDLWILQHCTDFCLCPLTNHLSSNLVLKVKNISSVFISRVKMHNTHYDLSPRPWPLPWCPQHSGQCWSSIAPQGQQDNRTTLSCLIFDGTAMPAGGDVCEQTGLKRFLLYTILFLCGWAPGNSKNSGYVFLSRFCLTLSRFLQV